jgi:hypothetical protein
VLVPSPLRPATLHAGSLEESAEVSEKSPTNERDSAFSPDRSL